MVSCGIRFVYLFLAVSGTVNMSLIRLVLRLMKPEFVVFIIRAFFQTAWYCLGPEFASTNMQYEGDCIGVIVLLGLICWSLALSVELFWRMKQYGVNIVLSILVMARTNEMHFNVLDKPGWIFFNFEGSIVYNLKSIYYLERASMTHSEVSVRY